MAKKKRFWQRASKAKELSNAPRAPRLEFGPLVLARMSDLGDTSGWPGVDTLKRIGRLELSLTRAMASPPAIDVWASGLSHRLRATAAEANGLLDRRGSLADLLRLWPAYWQIIEPRLERLAVRLERIEREHVEIQSVWTQLSVARLSWVQEQQRVSRTIPEERLDYIRRYIVCEVTGSDPWATAATRIEAESLSKRVTLAREAIEAVEATRQHFAATQLASVVPTANGTPSRLDIRDNLIAARAEHVELHRELMKEPFDVVREAGRKHASLLDVPSVKMIAHRMNQQFGRVISGSLALWTKLTYSRIR